MPIEFENNLIAVTEEINEKIVAFLYEAGAELQSQTQRNTRVDTGQLKGSWQSVVNESKLEVVVGSPLENAIWEEFGTGEYALHGDGRKGGWKYQDVKGKWHFTKGKSPSQAFTKAFTKLKKPIQKRFESVLKEE